MPSRNTEIKRTAVPESVRNRIWGRAAARCVLCADWLIDQQSYYHAVSTGQIAHIIGATNGTNSARSASELSNEERAFEDNLMLLCHSCHKCIDDTELRDFYSIEFLEQKRKQHHRRVREVTAFATLRPTTILSLTGSIRGTISGPSKRQIAEAIRHEDLRGFGEDTRAGLFEVELADSEQDSWVWERGKALIDKEISNLMSAVEAKQTDVVSVFAIGPVPTLAYLGSRLDDKTEVILFPRWRRDDALAWTWPSAPKSIPDFEFVTSQAANCVAPQREIVVLVNISATVNTERLPQTLHNKTILEVRPVDCEPTPDLIDSQAALDSFAGTWRQTLSHIESSWPDAHKLHIIAAVPTTAAIQLGRNRMRDAHPSFVVYQLDPDKHYFAALEIN